jgi:hypothetical protein
MAMAAMNMVSAGGFPGVSLHLRRCPQGVASVLCRAVRSNGIRFDSISIRRGPNIIRYDSILIRFQFDQNTIRFDQTVE